MWDTRFHLVTEVAKDQGAEPRGERTVQDFDPQTITNLSTGKVVFLIVCVPGIILLLLLWASFNFPPLV